MDNTSAAAMQRSSDSIIYLLTSLQAAPVIFEFTDSLVNTSEADKVVFGQAWMDTVLIVQDVSLNAFSNKQLLWSQSEDNIQIRMQT